MYHKGHDTFYVGTIRFLVRTYRRISLSPPKYGPVMNVVGGRTTRSYFQLKLWKETFQQLHKYGNV